MSKINITSEDNIPYQILETPGIAEFKEISYTGCSNLSDGYEIHHAYISCNQIREHALPLDANPREPTRGDVVKKMEETLREQPEKFHHWNNGITVICDDFKFIKETATIKVTLSEGTGVCNGGHTYFAISTFSEDIHPSAKVHVEFIKLPDHLSNDEKVKAINDIASMRNRNRALASSSQADYQGLYNRFKDALGDKKNLVKWHEGDSEAVNGAIPSELFIRFLASFDPMSFSHPVHSPAKPNHKSTGSGPGGIHQRWRDSVDRNDPEGNLYHLSPIALKMLTLIDEISYSIKEDSFSSISQGFRRSDFYKWLVSQKNDVVPDRELIFKGDSTSGAKLPDPARVMILGAFRHNIWLGKDEEGAPKFIGFIEDPVSLWNNSKIEYLSKLYHLFDDANREVNPFIKSNSPYDLQLLQIIYGRMLPSNPKEFYDIESGKKYQNNSTGSVLLESDEAGYASIIEKPDNYSGDGKDCYEVMT